MEKNPIWTYCSNCTNETKHTILHSKSVSTDVDLTNFQTVECNGCTKVSFRIENHEYWNVIDENGTHNIEISLYPNVLKGHNLIPSFYHLPKNIKSVYRQTILAFRGSSLLLAGVGFRAIIEAICIQEEIKGGNLELKINNLAKNRLITDKEAERLHSIRFLGNDSVHEMETPSEKTLFLVLDIVENLLKNLYIIDRQTKFLLDTLIKDFDEFETLLWSCAEKQKIDEERTLSQILGKHIRRVKIDFPIAEQEIVNRINSGLIQFLKLGDVKITGIESLAKQHFIYTGVIDDRLPF